MQQLIQDKIDSWQKQINIIDNWERIARCNSFDFFDFELYQQLRDRYCWFISDLKQLLNSITEQ